MRTPTTSRSVSLICTYQAVGIQLPSVKGDLNSEPPALVRVHINDTLRDVVGVRNERLGWPLHAAMRRVASEPSGVVVILRPEESPRHFMAACGFWMPRPPARALTVRR